MLFDVGSIGIDFVMKYRFKGKIILPGYHPVWAKKYREGFNELMLKNRGINKSDIFEA